MLWFCSTLYTVPERQAHRPQQQQQHQGEPGLEPVTDLHGTQHAILRNLIPGINHDNICREYYR
jgi:hypothetical protein